MSILIILDRIRGEITSETQSVGILCHKSQVLVGSCIVCVEKINVFLFNGLPSVFVPQFSVQYCQCDVLVRVVSRDVVADGCGGFGASLCGVLVFGCVCDAGPTSGHPFVQLLHGFTNIPGVSPSLTTSVLTPVSLVKFDTTRLSRIWMRQKKCLVAL